MIKNNSLQEENATKEPNKLSFKCILTIALKRISYCRAKLALAMVFAIISTAIFGFAMVGVTADPMVAELKAAYKSGVNTVILQGVITEKTKYVDANGKTISESKISSILPVKIIPEQIRKIEKLAPFMPSETITLYNRFNYGLGLMSRLVELDPKTGENDAKLKPDRRLTVNCRLPQNFKEIAITDYIADMFIELGYKDKNDDNKVHEINSPDDLIGKELYGLAICGVYETDNTKNWLKENYNSRLTYLWEKGEHMSTCGFVRSGFLADRDGHTPLYTEALYKLSGDIKKDKAILKSINAEVVAEPFYNTINQTVYTTYTHSVRIRTGMSGFIDEVDFLYNPDIIEIEIYASIILAIISMLLTMNYLTIGVNKHKQAVETLIKSGIRKADIVLICIFESMFIAIANFMLSLTLVGIICLIININILMPLFQIGVIPFFTVFAMCFVSVALSTILPTFKILPQYSQL